MPVGGNLAICTECFQDLGSVQWDVLFLAFWDNSSDSMKFAWNLLVCKISRDMRITAWCTWRACMWTLRTCTRHNDHNWHLTIGLHVGSEVLTSPPIEVTTSLPRWGPIVKCQSSLYFIVHVHGEGCCKEYVYEKAHTYSSSYTCLGFSARTAAGEGQCGSWQRDAFSMQVPWHEFSMYECKCSHTRNFTSVW